MQPSGSDSSVFLRLHPTIQRWIWERGWTELREVQEAAGEAILAARGDVVITAATAGGKTEAAFLPVLTRVAESDESGIRVLYVSPLKALINDQFDRLRELGERIGIPVHRWHGDVSAAEKRAVLKAPDGVLLITPESIEAMFVLRGNELPRLVSGLAFVVVDELHAFIGTERGRQLQSLLHRVEVAGGRRVPRVALSATLGDMRLAAGFLRPGMADDVEVVATSDDGHELRMIVKGYVDDPPASDDGGEVENPGIGESAAMPNDASEAVIAAHMFSTLRGSKNLVFANSRRNVEAYADLLRRACDDARLPVEFWPHHGSLSREFREDAELRLKDGAVPATLVCTTTLELGIDVGAVKSVAQVGAPPSVSSLRQRLGRSGRRGEPAVLRFYISEAAVGQDSSPIDALRIETVQTIAMIRLLLDRWYEPPNTGALHLSTLLQQVLSLIAERGAVTAARAFEILCRNGPFKEVDAGRFADLLRAMGNRDLVTQTHDGLLVPGATGERLINRRDFYAVFATPEEFTLVAGGRPLGTLPVTYPILPDTHMIFGGKRWRVLSVDEERKVVDLAPSPGGNVPRFSGGIGGVHGRVREEMLAVYLGKDVPPYLDRGARDLLAEGRAWFRRLGLDRTRVVERVREALLFCWTSDRVANTVQAMIANAGLRVARSGPVLAVRDAGAGKLAELAAQWLEAGPPDPLALASRVPHLRQNKYDEYLPDDLLAADYAARELDPEGTLTFLRIVAARGDGEHSRM